MLSSSADEASAVIWPVEPSIRLTPLNAEFETTEPDLVTQSGLKSSFSAATARRIQAKRRRACGRLLLHLDQKIGDRLTGGQGNVDRGHATVEAVLSTAE